MFTADQDPRLWTVEFAQTAGYKLAVYCQGRCRSGREVDLLALAAAGKARRRIDTLQFRCEACGGKGVPLVSWWAGGYSSFDFGTGHLKGELPAAQSGGAKDAKSPRS